jgi:ribosomal protein S27AE
VTDICEYTFNTLGDGWDDNELITTMVYRFDESEDIWDDHQYGMDYICIGWSGSKVHQFHHWTLDDVVAILKECPKCGHPLFANHGEEYSYIGCSNCEGPEQSLIKYGGGLK